MRGPEINKPKLNRRRRRQRPFHRAACTAQAARAGRAASRRPKPFFAAPDSFGTHAPTVKENQPEMPERKHAAAPNAVWARPLPLASDPVATGRPRPGQPRPRARKWVIVKVNAPPRKSINLNYIG